MRCVLDASIAAAWLLPDERSAMADRIMEIVSSQGADCPLIWWYEVRNLLIVAERRSRIEHGAADHLTGLLALMQIEFAGIPNSAALLSLARTHNLTIYDAAYLDLAKQRGAPLATLDKRLAEAARAEGVTLA
ncbi:MAG: type II toxin-antitoxin system VapC family toxin [Rhizobiaceae bacterium]